MPIYRYVCGKPKKDRCTLSQLPSDFFDEDNENNSSLDFGDDRFIFYNEDGDIDPHKSKIVQLVYHGMFEDKEVKCPVCEIKASKVIGKVTSFFPGNCFLNKADCKRQMMLHKLENDDPYGHMRPEGDKENLIKKIKLAGKTPPKNFYPGGKGGLKASSPERPG